MYQLNHNQLVTEGTAKLINHATYTGLFGSSPRNLFSIYADILEAYEKLDEFDNNGLIRAFTVERM